MIDLPNVAAGPQEGELMMNLFESILTRTLIEKYAASQKWLGAVLCIWFLGMAVHFLSCLAVALKHRKSIRVVAIQYLWNKIGVFLVVVVAAIIDGIALIADVYLSALDFACPKLSLFLVLIGVIADELIGILSNAELLGAVLPPWLQNMPKVWKKWTNRKGRDYMDNSEED